MGYIGFSFPFIPIHSHSLPFMKPLHFVCLQPLAAEPLVRSAPWTPSTQRCGRVVSDGLIKQHGTEDLLRHLNAVLN